MICVKPLESNTRLLKDRSFKITPIFITRRVNEDLLSYEVTFLVVVPGM